MDCTGNVMKMCQGLLGSLSAKTEDQLDAEFGGADSRDYVLDGGVKATVRRRPGGMPGTSSLSIEVVDPTPQKADPAKAGPDREPPAPKAAGHAVGYGDAVDRIVAGRSPEAAWRLHEALRIVANLPDDRLDKAIELLEGIM